MPSRFRAALLFLVITTAAWGAPAPSHQDIMRRVAAIHGDAGPWAVAGFRIGQRALQELALPPYSFRFSVLHRSPLKVQYSCLIDGVQAATGASVGKMNLRMEEAPVSEMETIVEDRRTSRRLVFHLRPELIASILNVPSDQYPKAVERVLTLPDEQLFTLEIEG